MSDATAFAKRHPALKEYEMKMNKTDTVIAVFGDHPAAESAVRGIFMRQLRTVAMRPWLDISSLPPVPRRDP